MTRDRCSTCGLSRTALSHSLSLSLRYFLSLILSFSLFFSISTLLLSFTSSPLLSSPLLISLYPFPILSSSSSSFAPPQSLSCQSQVTPIHSFLLLSYSPSHQPLRVWEFFCSNLIPSFNCLVVILIYFPNCLIPSSHDPLKVWGTRVVDLVFFLPSIELSFPSLRLRSRSGTLPFSHSFN